MRPPTASKGFGNLWGLVRGTGGRCFHAFQCFSGSTACNTETLTVTDPTERVPAEPGETGPASRQAPKVLKASGALVRGTGGQCFHAFQ